MQKFDEKIIMDINKWSYPVWFIIKNNEVNCPCVDYATGQPDPKCKKCFGTGKKIKIRQMKTAHQNIDLRIMGEGIASGEKAVMSVYYTLKDAKATEGDYILDGDTLDVVQHYYPMRSDHSAPIYYKYETAPKKTNYKLTLNNIREVIKGAGYKC